MAQPGFVDFWIDLAERTFRSFMQAFVGALGVGGVTGTGVTAAASAHPLMHLPWEFASEVGGVAGVLCFFTGLGALPFGDKNTASFLPEENKPEALKAMFKHDDNGEKHDDET